MFTHYAKFTKKEQTIVEQDYRHALEQLKNEKYKKHWITEKIPIYDYLIERAKKSKHPEYYCSIIEDTRKKLNTIGDICYGITIGGLVATAGVAGIALIDIPFFTEYNGTTDIISNKYTYLPLIDFHYADDNMKEYAKEITKDCKDDECKAEKIFDAIKNKSKLGVEYYKAGSYNNDPYKGREGYKTAIEMFYRRDQNGNLYGTCIEQANLFIALARSIGMDSNIATMNIKKESMIEKDYRPDRIIISQRRYDNNFTRHAAVITHKKDRDEFYTDLTLIEEPVIKEYENYVQKIYYPKWLSEPRQYSVDRYFTYNLTDLRELNTIESTIHQNLSKYLLNLRYYKIQPLTTSTMLFSIFSTISYTSLDICNRVNITKKRNPNKKKETTVN